MLIARVRLLVPCCGQGLRGCGAHVPGRRHAALGDTMGGEVIVLRKALIMRNNKMLGIIVGLLLSAAWFGALIGFDRHPLARQQ